MTKDEILQMARDAGFFYVEGSIDNGIEISSNVPQELMRFAELIAAAERERCAKVCDSFNEGWYAYRRGAEQCAASIRATR